MNISKTWLWAAGLKVEFHKLKSDSKITFKERYNVSKNDIDDQNLPLDFTELYGYSNGMEFNWSTDDTREIGGRIHFLSYEDAFLYVREHDTWQIQQEETLPYFRPIDLITDEAECGIIYNGKEHLGNMMFYLERGDANLQSLDINFDGYLELLKMSRGFYYWPKALLDIESGNESEETKNFKKYMPQIFEDFNWGDFVTKYESLRLSKKE